MSPRRALLALAEFLVAHLVGLLFGLLRLLGPRRASNLGGFVARRLGPLLPVSRVGRANLAAAFPEHDAPWIEARLVEVWDNLGRTVCEYPHLASLRRVERLEPGTVGYRIEGEEHFRAAVENAKPAILVSAHLGNWEMLPVSAHQAGRTLGVVYRAVGNGRIDRRIAGFRRAATAGDATPLFPKGSAGARATLAHLGKGGPLGILADQKMNDGIAVRFFGRDAMTAVAPAQLALRFDAAVLPARCVRVGPAAFRVVLDPILPLPTEGSRSERAHALTQAITETIERWIRAHPGQWLWLHRRWPKGSVAGAQPPS